MGRNFGRRSYDDDDNDYYDDDKYYGSDDEFETSDLEDPDARHERLVSEVRAGLEDRSSLVSEDMITETLLMVNNDSDKALECILRGYLDKQLLETLACSILDTLAEDAKYTNKMAIEDSLYHYYYNEQKALAYVEKQILTQKNKAEAEGKSSNLKSLFSKSDSSHSAIPRDCGYDTPGTPRNITALFSDMPWLSIPQDQMVNFTPLTPPVRQGLLGGSKLQALAARRKKLATGSGVGLSTPTPSTMAEPQIREKLAQVSLHDRALTPSAEKSLQSDDTLAKRPAQSDQPQPPHKRLYRPSRSSVVDVETSSDLFEVEDDVAKSSPPVALEVTMPRVPLAKPSSFAQALFGPRQDTSSLQQTYPLPYESSSQFAWEVFSQPSPDDIVLKSQSQATRIRNLKKKPSVESERQESNELVGNIKAKGFRKPQSKKLDVIELYKQRVAHEKRTCSFVVVGHVDAGKSTLMGRLLMEVGAVDQYSVSKNESDAAKVGKKSFGLAWVMDQREEERERGVTIDIATNFFETEKTKFTVLDAPGHRDFVPNMISGSCQADFAVLVIDSNTNAFERGLKGQTLEHILLLRSLGIQCIIIAVNKLDMVGWSQERYEEIVEHVRAFMLKLSFPAHTISFVPICGQDGTNVAKKPIHNSSLDWYSGETLVEALESVRSPKKVLDRPMRIAVSETFTTGFAGLTVSGRIQVGTLQIGDELVVASSRAPLCYVKSILVGEEARDWAVAGDLVDIVVVGIEDTEIQPGDVLSISSNPVNLSREFSLKALAFKPLMADTIDLHRGRNHSSGCIIATPAILDKVSGVAKKINPTRVQEGEVARIIVVVNHLIAIDPGQRVVLRKDGETIAAGVVEQ